ncbi:MAG: ABC transporter permease [Pseudomonadota bacterium]
MSLVAAIAFTHVASRVRQTLVGLFGVAMGVGFSVMMAALMEGSQRDFVDRLIDSLPHVTVHDERRAPPRQPAEARYDAVAFAGLRRPETRPGLKNPLAIMAGIESWLPGAAAPSAEARAVLRYAGRDAAASVTGVDPRREARVSKLESQIEDGSLQALRTASTAILLGDRLAETLGARVGATIAVSSGAGRTISATVVGLVHSGVAEADETRAYTRLETAQILAGQRGLVSALRIRVDDVDRAAEVAARIEAQTGYKSVSWQEANEELLSAFEIRNFIMYTVVGAILLVASFGTYNIISTITHEKTRDIAIMKSLGFTERRVRRIFLLEALMIGSAGALLGWALGYALSRAMGAIEFDSPYMDSTELPMLYAARHYLIAGGVALAASAIAGYLPARRAARRRPVEIIRGAS